MNTATKITATTSPAKFHSIKAGDEDSIEFVYGEITYWVSAYESGFENWIEDTFEEGCFYIAEDIDGEPTTERMSFGEWYREQDEKNLNKWFGEFLTTLTLNEFAAIAFSQETTKQFTETL